MKSKLKKLLAKSHAKLSLAEIQTLMLAGITNPLGSDYGASAAIKAAGESIESFARRFIKPGAKLSSGARLAIYNRQYWYRLLDALYDDLPGVRHILGETRFRRLCEEYLSKFPSKSFTLRDLPLKLEEFLTKNPAFLKYRGEALIEMLRFELAQILAFDGQEALKLNPKKLTGISPTRIKIGLQPYMTLLQLNYPFDKYAGAILKHSRQQSEAGAVSRRRARSAGKLPKRQKIFLAVHRFDDVVYFKRLSAPEFAVLSALKSGKSLSAACAAGACAATLKAGSRSKVEDQLSAWFGEWMSLGWLTQQRGRL